MATPYCCLLLLLLSLIQLEASAESPSSNSSHLESPGKSAPVQSVPELLSSYGDDVKSSPDTTTLQVDAETPSTGGGGGGEQQGGAETGMKVRSRRSLPVFNSTALRRRKRSFKTSCIVCGLPSYSQQPVQFQVSFAKPAISSGCGSNCGTPVQYYQPQPQPQPVYRPQQPVYRPQQVYHPPAQPTCDPCNSPQQQQVYRPQPQPVYRPQAQPVCDTCGGSQPSGGGGYSYSSASSSASASASSYGWGKK